MVAVPCLSPGWRPSSADLDQDFSRRSCRPGAARTPPTWRPQTPRGAAPLQPGHVSSPAHRPFVDRNTARSERSRVRSAALKDRTTREMSRLASLAPRRLGRGRRRPPQARPQLVGHDLDGRAGAAVLSGPAALLEPAHDHGAACSAWSRQTTTVKNDASCSRRPDTATRNMARAIPPSVCRSSGSSVRLPAKLTAASVMVHPS
jgi:hypothetical protein